MFNNNFAYNERTAIELWNRNVESERKVISSPLEECPQCHCLPKVMKNNKSGEAFLRCPKCGHYSSGKDPIKTKSIWNTWCQRCLENRTKAEQQAEQLKRIIGGGKE
ncbi:hypothetical protein [Bifidobacterium scaligerum]|uniref:Restriction alleviation protein, Lar family n=1 Tax=Bifidobacterium scaligerum TaxID=2052656 RepID=A0A2M9HT42_9BIFI|nr:hypothetical protein CUU80_02240 [Bifidobacterium scaligerum]